MNRGEPQFRRESRLSQVAAQSGVNFLPLALHPGVSVRTEGGFLRSIAELSSMLEDSPLCFIKGAELSLVYGKDSVLHVHSRRHPFPEYEIVGADHLRTRRNKLGTLITVQVDQDTYQIQLHELEDSEPIVVESTRVQRTTSPWRAPARESIYNRSSESGGCAGGGER
jgi:hypothetical protein